MKNCSKAKCFLSVIAVFVFTLAYDWLVFGTIIMPQFPETTSLWRPESQMQQMMPWCLAFHFFVALVVTCMFKNYKNYSPEACSADPELAKKCKPCSRGMCFGIHLGLIFGLGMFANYIWLPVPLTLGAAWFAAGLLKGVGVGAVLAAMCGGKKDCSK